MPRWGGRVPPEKLVERSFEFLLQREVQHLRSFDLHIIQQYFPEYERTIWRDVVGWRVVSTAPQSADSNFDARRITRPAPVLMRYYAIYSLAGLIAFPILLLQLYFRYHTLRYRFDEEGISVSWGVLFRKEVNLTYRRIQDINLSRNVLQRWMGLATIEVQTASGSATAEVTIEGVLEAEQLRDFLYSKMRGARDDGEKEEAAAAPADEALSLLRDIRDQLVRLRGGTVGAPGTERT